MYGSSFSFQDPKAVQWKEIRGGVVFAGEREGGNKKKRKKKTSK